MSFKGHSACKVSAEYRYEGSRKLSTYRRSKQGERDLDQGGGKKQTVKAFLQVKPIALLVARL